jgi:hypothetical protein
MGRAGRRLTICFSYRQPEKAATSGQSPEEKREPVPANWEEREGASATTTEAMETGTGCRSSGDWRKQNAGRGRRKRRGGSPNQDESPDKRRGSGDRNSEEDSREERRHQTTQARTRLEDRGGKKEDFRSAEENHGGDQQGDDTKAGLSTGRPASGPRGVGGNPGSGKRHSYGGCPGKRGACVAGETATDGGHSRERHQGTVSKEAGPAPRGSGQGSRGGTTSEKGGKATVGAVGNRRKEEGREEKPGGSDQRGAAPCGGATEGTQSQGGSTNGAQSQRRRENDLRAEAERGSPRDRRVVAADSRCGLKGVLQQVDIKVIGGPVAQMSTRKDGYVALACNTKALKEKLEQELRKKEGVTVRDIPRMNRTLTLTGLEAHWSAEEVVADGHQKNDWLHGGQPLDEFRKSFAFLTKRKCQNERRQNMVFAVEPKILHEAMDRGKIVVGLSLCFVAEEIRVKQCFRCHRFGHMARECKSKELCFKCGKEGHRKSECTAEARRCPNCVRANEPLRDGQEVPRIPEDDGAEGEQNREDLNGIGEYSYNTRDNLLVFQVNLGRGREATDLLQKTVLEQKADRIKMQKERDQERRADLREVFKRKRTAYKEAIREAKIQSLRRTLSQGSPQDPWGFAYRFIASKKRGQATP